MLDTAFTLRECTSGVCFSTLPPRVQETPRCTGDIYAVTTRSYHSLETRIAVACVVGVIPAQESFAWFR